MTDADIILMLSVYSAALTGLLVWVLFDLDRLRNRGDHS